MNVWMRNFVYMTILMFALPYLIYRSLRTGRYRAGLRQKLLGIKPQDLSQSGLPSTGPVFWLHGVSVGEVQLLAPLVDQLHRSNPGASCCLSTTTESGMQLAKKLMPDIPLFFFPLDFSWAIRKTLRTLQPSVVVLGELELWPNLVQCAHEMSIPTVVVNGRLSERSYRGYRRLSWLVGGTFAKLTHVATQSDSYATRFVGCGCPSDRVSVTGSLKFDNLTFDRNSPEIAKLRVLAGLQPQYRILVVGSTQSPEEWTACHAFLELKLEFPDLRLIVVPRHPDRFQAVHDSLQRLPVRIVRRTEIVSPLTASEWDVLLVDTVGELKWWWGLAEMAIVGGSFGKRGGQNMLEPAAYGANVAFGPNTDNFKDIVELLLAKDAAVRLPNLESMSPWIRQQLENREPGLTRGANARKVIADQQGAMQRTVMQLNSVLAASSAKTHQRAA